MGEGGGGAFLLPLIPLRAEFLLCPGYSHIFAVFVTRRNHYSYLETNIAALQLTGYSVLGIENQSFIVEQFFMTSHDFSQNSLLFLTFVLFAVLVECVWDLS